VICPEYLDVIFNLLLAGRSFIVYFSGGALVNMPSNKPTAAFANELTHVFKFDVTRLGFKLTGWREGALIRIEPTSSVPQHLNRRESEHFLWTYVNVGDIGDDQS
jgi:hypothetical protein